MIGPGAIRAAPEPQQKESDTLLMNLIGERQIRLGGGRMTASIFDGRSASGAGGRSPAGGRVTHAHTPAFGDDFEKIESALSGRRARALIRARAGVSGRRLAEGRVCFTVSIFRGDGLFARAASPAE